MRRKKRGRRSALIQAYGLFWHRSEINWSPGKGKRYDWRLYGRQGKNSGKIQVADFREQRGIYILYGNYGPHYVGLTRRKGLGRRLKDHLTGRHAEHWDRFSWFGFRKVLKKKDEYGLRLLGGVPISKSVNPDGMISDFEALLIRSMALKNINHMNFVVAKRWDQIKRDEIEKFSGRL